MEDGNLNKFSPVDPYHTNKADWLQGDQMRF
jgi:hypothetical protein